MRTMKSDEKIIKCDFVKDVKMTACDRENSDKESNAETITCSFKEVNELNDETMKERFIITVHDEKIIINFNIMRCD